MHCFINNSVITVINFYHLRTDQELKRPVCGEFMRVLNFLRRFNPFWPGVGYSGISDADIKSDKMVENMIEIVQYMFFYRNKNFLDFHQDIKLDHE